MPRDIEKQRRAQREWYQRKIKDDEWLKEHKAYTKEYRESHKEEIEDSRRSKCYVKPV